MTHDPAILAQVRADNLKRLMPMIESLQRVTAPMELPTFKKGCEELNRHVPALTAEKAISPALRPIQFKPGQMYEIFLIARKMAQHANNAVAIPRYPECIETIAAHEREVSDALAELMELMANG